MPKKKMETEFSIIPSEHILKVWNNIAPLLEKLIKRQGFSSLEEEFKKIAINKSHTLWIAWNKKDFNDVVMVLQTRIYDNILQIESCAGKDLNSWMNCYLEHCETLAQYGRDNNCKKSLIFNGRKGWSKILSKIDMKVTGYSYEKEL